MRLRKIAIAVDCEDDAQRDRIQNIMDEVSGMRLLNGNQIENIYPFFRSHQAELFQLFGMVANGGVKSLMSGQGISLITKIARK